jgi:hypothetical protein
MRALIVAEDHSLGDEESEAIEVSKESEDAT